jgi:hypothetical protein
MVRHSKVFPDRSMFYPPQDATVTRVLAAGITFAKCGPWGCACGGVCVCVCVWGGRALLGCVACA